MPGGIWPRRWVLFVPAVLAALMGSALPGVAQAPPQGTFFASKACPAYRSFIKGTNPGNVAVVPKHSYQVVAGNKPEPTHYWIIVPGADPDRRWVSTDCGTFTSTSGVSIPPHTAPEAAGDKSTPIFRTQYVFAFGWEPAFCELHETEPECTSLVIGSPQTRQFSLHGLWPDPREYCGVKPAQVADDKAGRWSQLPAVALDSATRSALDAAMPGTRSLLERHEWIKHGTCSGMTENAYFAASTHLMQVINTSQLRDLFEARAGETLTIDAVREAVNAAFGPGTGARLRMSCVDDDNRRLITELTIGLTGTIRPDSDVAGLILAAAPTKGGCNSGVVDLVGAQ